MDDDILSNLTSASGDHAAACASSARDAGSKKKRGIPCNPDPDAEVVALSPRSLIGTNKFICEVCGKGFRRDQNLQLHRRGHNLPWKLKQRRKDEPVRRKVYVCPELTCAHHDPSRALGDLTGIKKHFFRKHGEKRWKCERCEKRYAVRSDWKAHSKVCGTREYKCDCGTVFSRRDSFITHRAFCDALTHETMMKSLAAPPPMPLSMPPTSLSEASASAFFSPSQAATPSSSGLFSQLSHFGLPSHFLDNPHGFPPLPPPAPHTVKPEPEPEQYRVPNAAIFGQHHHHHQAFCFPSPSPNPSASATALLHKATMMGTIARGDIIVPSAASGSRADHEGIDLLEDMNMTATMMMMGSIAPEEGLGFHSGGGTIDGILESKGSGGGGDGKGATRDFLSLSRGFPPPPAPPQPRKADLLGLQMQQEEEEEGDNDDNDHRHNVWFME